MRQTAPIADGLLTVADVAARIRIGKSTVYTLDIPVVYIGRTRRYRAVNVDAFVAARRVPRGDKPTAP